MDNELKAQTRLLHKHANQMLEDFILGSTSTTNLNEPRAFTEKDLLRAIKEIKSQDLLSQQKLITLMGAIGFNVLVNPYVEEPMVILPEEYSEAMAKCCEIEK